MSQSTSIPLREDSALAEPEYRAVDPWAVAGLIVGLLSPLALVDTPWWLVPLAGLGMCAIALARIQNNPDRIGRGLALAGLALSVTFITAPAAQLTASYLIVAPQGRPVADKWFELLREQKPERALTLTFLPDHRDSTDDQMWFTYAHDAEAKRRLRAFVKEPFVRTMLALGEKAEVRFHGTDSVAVSGQRAQVAYVYTVTYEDGDGKKTFFARIVLKREPSSRAWLNPWHIDNFRGGIDPHARSR